MYLKFINTMGIISIHAPREGGDGASPPTAPGAGDFNPRPPRGGRQLPKELFIVHQDISIHAPREGGDLEVNKMVKIRIISIHAPREGGDCATSSA